MARKIKTTASELRNAKQSLNYGQVELAKLFSKDEAEFKTHADGTVERIGKVDMTMIAHFLKGRRAYDKYDVMEELHKESINFLVDAGYAIKVINPRSPKCPTFFVTQKAADKFGLKPVTSMGMPFKFMEA